MYAFNVYDAVLKGGNLIYVNNNLNPKYKNLINALKISLEKMQEEIGHRERKESKSHLFKTYQPALFKIIDEFLVEHEIIASDFTDGEHKTHGEYFRSEINPIALKSPYNKRCFDKPLGYPGDYLMMEMLYSNARCGDSVFAQLLNAHTLQMPFANAVRKRCAKIENELKETICRNPESSILSVAAGPAWEIRNLQKNIKSNHAEFFLLDQDKSALAFARKKLSGHDTHIYYLEKNVVGFVKEKQTSKFDLIYSMGLFDYLPQKFAQRLVRHLFNLLKKEGRLIIGNATFNPHRRWMEYGVEWYLIYRTDRELLDLTQGLPSKRIGIMNDDDNIGRMFSFLRVAR